MGLSDSTPNAEVKGSSEDFYRQQFCHPLFKTFLYPNCSYIGVRMTPWLTMDIPVPENVQSLYYLLNTFINLLEEFESDYDV